MDRGREDTTPSNTEGIKKVTREGHTWRIKGLYNPCVLIFFIFLESWPHPLYWFWVPYTKQNWQTYLNALWVTLHGRKSPSKQSPNDTPTDNVVITKGCHIGIHKNVFWSNTSHSLLKATLNRISLLTRHRPWTQMSLVSVPQGVPSATLSFNW